VKSTSVLTSLCQDKVAIADHPVEDRLRTRGDTPVQSKYENKLPFKQGKETGTVCGQACEHAILEEKTNWKRVTLLIALCLVQVN
jgi:hypothetical protein